MRKEALFLLVLLLGLMMILPLASAEISINQPRSLYNLGDAFNFSISLTENQKTNDFVVAELVCGSGFVEIYRSPAELEPGEEKKIDVETILDTSVLGKVKGDCRIDVRYDDDKVSGRQFEISSESSPIVNLAGDFFDPGQEITISGSSIKKNGNPLEGFAEITIDDSITSISSVVNGDYIFNISLPEDIGSGRFEVVVRTYEKDFSDEIINEGTTETSLEIKQVLSRIDIAISSIRITPGEDILYTLLAYDQSNKEMDLEASVILKNPAGSVIEENVVKSGRLQNITTSGSYDHGTWLLEGKLGEQASTKSFFVEELEDAEFVMEDNVLVVKNKGNVPYSKPVAVNIGDKQEVRDVFIPVNDEKRYRLNAPDGDYGIKVTTTNSSVDLGRVFLTGNSVAVKDNDGQKIFSKIPSLWFLLAILLGVVVYFYYGKMRTEKLMPILAPRQSASSGSSGGSSTIQSGQKQKSVVVVVKVKNHDTISNENTKATLDEVSDLASKFKAKTTRNPDSVVFVLAPLNTKKEDNSVEGVKLASEISSTINNHNKKFKEIIAYGVGVGDGELVVEMKNDKFQFSSVGSTVSSAKNLAESSEGDVLVSDGIHSSTRAQVKVDRANNGWKVREIKDSKKHSGFIDNFKKNYKKDEVDRLDEEETKS